MDIQQFYQLTQKGTTPDKSEIEPLALLIDKYPYFQGALFSYLKAVYEHCDHHQFDPELNRLSISIKDRRALFYYILSEEYDRFFAESGKEDLGVDKTNILLNAFFESRNETGEDADLEYNLSHSSMATTDYFSYIRTSIDLEEENESDGEEKATIQLKHHAIIDSFIHKSDEEGGIRIQMEKGDNLTSNNIPDNEEENDNELNDDIFFTETLAKIYIKQKKYEKAYKIIKHLSLNYPKKNIYFADQLSFLEKLIINSKYKAKK